eukprot:11150019-Alexandrium_andersonii.AAC.1
MGFQKVPSEELPSEAKSPEQAPEQEGSPSIGSRRPGFPGLAFPFLNPDCPLFPPRCPHMSRT